MTITVLSHGKSTGIASPTGSSGSGTVTIDTVTGSPTMLVAACTYFGQNPGLSSATFNGINLSSILYSSNFTDTNGNVWYKARCTSAAAIIQTYLLYCVNPTYTNSNHIFSFSGSAVYGGVYVAALSGTATTVATGRPQTNIIVNQPAAAAPSVTSNSVTPAVNNSLIVSAWGWNTGTNGNTPTFSAGQTVLDVQTSTTGTTFGYAITVELQTTATASAPSISDASNVVNVNCSRLVIPPASAGAMLDNSAAAATGTVTKLHRLSNGKLAIGAGGKARKLSVSGSTYPQAGLYQGPGTWTNAPLIGPNGSSSAATLTLKNEGAATLAAGSTTVGVHFYKGEVPSGRYLTATAGTVQIDPKTSWSDGSVKMAAVTVARPAITAGSSVTFNMSATTTSPGTPISLATALNTHSFSISLALFGGTATVYDMKSIFTAGTGVTYWLQGPLATQGRYITRISGTPLRMIVDLTAYVSGGFHADVLMYNDIANEASDTLGLSVGVLGLRGQITYDLSATFDGTTYINVRQGQDQYQRAVFQFSTNSIDGDYALGTPTAGYLNIKHDITKYQKLGVFPPIDTSFGFWENRIGTIGFGLSDLLNAGGTSGYLLDPTLGGPLLSNYLNVSMGSAGERPEIGPVTAYQAGWLMTQDIRCAKFCILQAQSCGSIPFHWWDTANNNYVNVTNYPALWAVSNFSGTSTGALTSASTVLPQTKTSWFWNWTGDGSTKTFTQYNLASKTSEIGIHDNALGEISGTVSWSASNLNTNTPFSVTFTVAPAAGSSGYFYRGYNGWNGTDNYVYDDAHMPQLPYVPYVLTAKHWLYDFTISQGYAMMIGTYNPQRSRITTPGVAGGAPYDWTNGPYMGQTRAGAWITRDLENALWVAVDGSQQKTDLQGYSTNNWSLLKNWYIASKSGQGEHYGWMWPHGWQYAGGITVFQQSYHIYTMLLAAGRGNADAQTCVDYMSNWLINSFLNPSGITVYMGGGGDQGAHVVYNGDPSVILDPPGQYTNVVKTWADVLYNSTGVENITDWPVGNDYTNLMFGALGWLYQYNANPYALTAYKAIINTPSTSSGHPNTHWAFIEPQYAFTIPGTYPPGVGDAVAPTTAGLP